jgi:hypothetical protein
MTAAPSPPVPAPRLTEMLSSSGKDMSKAALVPKGRIASYQLCDFNLPIAADPLLSRGMMGDGGIDFPAITQLVATAPYHRPVEVEIFNADIWSAPADHVVAVISRRWRSLVPPWLNSTHATTLTPASDVPEEAVS